MDSTELINTISDWLNSRNITDVVIGYSGGIDSAVTSALLGHCEVRVHLAVAEAPQQIYSSPLGGAQGARDFVDATRISAVVHEFKYKFMFSDDNANEAAAPIQRVAGFYGICAKLRSEGARAIVVGTTNFDEAGYLGFWGKASDAAQDFYPISHLHKSDVLSIAKQLSVPTAIQSAIPSGDLLFRKTNDREMIGATYDQIEAIAKALEHGATESKVRELMTAVESPGQLLRQIIQNKFKYDLPFCGFHISNRLEGFRRSHYKTIIKAAKEMAEN